MYAKEYPNKIEDIKVVDMVKYNVMKAKDYMFEILTSESQTFELAFALQT
jgi:hypothetical protein